MPKQKVSKEKSIRRTKNFVQLVVCLAVIGTGAYYIKDINDRSGKVGQAPAISDGDAEVTTVSVPTEAYDPNKVIYEPLTVKTTDKFRGNLILVNEDHQYFGGGEDLVSILEKNDEKGITYFTSVDYTYTILANVYEPMVKMISDFYSIYSNDTLTIYGSYRTTEFQQQLYDEDLANTGDDKSTRVAKPGFSEHESGYAFDFSETVNNDYDGTGDFAWINENCYKYGFVLRYTKEKESITKIQPEPWHFRFVGIPHSYYMTKNNLCLEEYIDLLRKYPYDGQHLEITDEDKKSYEVYFVARNGLQDCIVCGGAEENNIPVPAGKEYDISGNNVDGFIVTVYNDGRPELMKAQTAPAETTTASADETSSENSEGETSGEADENANQ